MHYLTFIYPDDTGFGFTCADVDGFTAYCETTDFDAAVAEAKRVLAVHLAAVLDHGGELPVARTFTALRIDPDLQDDFEEAGMVTYLPALLPAGRTKKITLTMDENTLRHADAEAKARGLTRSGFLAAAARQMAS
jgi:predicted RNase H-like HicB family nuclease